MYGNKSQMSWKPNSRTFIALAPCERGVDFANEFVTMLPWLMAMGLKGVYANHNESPFEHLFLLAPKGLFP